MRTKKLFIPDREELVKELQEISPVLKKINGYREIEEKIASSLTDSKHNVPKNLYSIVYRTFSRYHIADVYLVRLCLKYAKEVISEAKQEIDLYLNNYTHDKENNKAS